mmetsp:Transcript_7370/g.18164  ORF Transcript_7370/g.18164 Transcript_7370/m.18164 type:complete len:201 (-) Transcript_7370:45-647(-)
MFLMAARAPPWRVAALFCYDPSSGARPPTQYDRETTRRCGPTCLVAHFPTRAPEPRVQAPRAARPRRPSSAASFSSARRRARSASAPRRPPPSGRCRAARRWRASRSSRPSRRPWFGVARPRWMSKAASSRRCQRAMPSNATQRPRPCDWYRGRRRRGPRNRRAPTYPVGRRRRPRRTHRCTAAPGASPRRASRKKAAPT